MKSYVVHYKNKYPKCQVRMSESGLDVYSQEGHHLVSLAKNGAGQVVDQSEAMGCLERHDLSPIPKECRAFKLYADGTIKPSEEYSERMEWSEKNAKKSAHGYSYHDGAKA